jgi:3-hydroxybutyryl-CoA dehydrogenase
MMPIQIIGVIGAGVIGSGVAQDLAQTGYRVVLLDLSEGILERARKEIVNNARIQSMFRKTKAAIGHTHLLDRIQFSTDYERLREVDLLIENASEKWEVKKGIYTSADGICPEHCVFAANTSAIPITRLASVTRRKHKVVGTHFMNPVPLKPVVELIRGYHTSDETVETIRSFLATMDKECIIVNDAPGFVSNRVLMLAINEAIFVLQERVASTDQIDRIFKTCFGHKMGLLETADLIGLDTVLYSIEVLYESFQESKYRPCPLLRRMVDAGLLGQKSGQGFYSYQLGMPEASDRCGRS